METLGNLVDRLAVVDLKVWHCQERMRQSDDDALKAKNASLLVQRQRLIKEIDAMFEAIKRSDDVVLVNPSNKLY